MSKPTDYDKPLRPGPLSVGFDSFFGIPSSLDFVPYVYVEDDKVVERPTQKIADSKSPREGGAGFIDDGVDAGGVDAVLAKQMRRRAEQAVARGFLVARGNMLLLRNRFGHARQLIEPPPNHQAASLRRK